MTLSAHAAQRYRHRVKPGPDSDATRGELARLRAMGEIFAPEPVWLGAAKATPDDLLIGDATVLPLLPQACAWGGDLRQAKDADADRREANTAHKASLAARKRAQRRARY